VIERTGWSRSAGFVQALIWLALGVGFAHLFLGTGRAGAGLLHPASDLR
jgi:hypothetical protein